jgi:hypothetical protein
MKANFRHSLIAPMILALSALNPRLSTAFAQGSLTPPGAPAPTMLTLSQIEPRTPISSSPYTITQPGSYYLTTNIVGVSSQNGINIYANNVTLDLNGFSLQGVTSALNGISIQTGYTNVTVRNGTISGWGTGWKGIECFGNNVILEHLILSGNPYAGLYWVGNTGVIRDCMVSGSPYGIFMGGSGLLVIGNDLIGNGTGIYVDNGVNQIEGNHITGSGGYGIEIPGAFTGATNNLIIRNVVRGSGANNYSFNSSQIAGPLITNTVSGIVTNSNPWANFSF